MCVEKKEDRHGMSLEGNDATFMPGRQGLSASQTWFNIFKSSIEQCPYRAMNELAGYADLHWVLWVIKAINTFFLVGHQGEGLYGRCRG